MLHGRQRTGVVRTLFTHLDECNFPFADASRHAGGYIKLPINYGSIIEQRPRKRSLMKDFKNFSTFAVC